LDEPVLFVRVGAYSHRFGLAEVLRMMRDARGLARDVAERKPGAAEFAESIVSRGEAGDVTAALTVWLLNDAMGEENWRLSQQAITVPGQAQQQETPAAPATSVASVAGACPVPHPPDVACPSCAGQHQERRNAQKRAAREAAKGA